MSGNTLSSITLHAADLSFDVHNRMKRIDVLMADLERLTQYCDGVEPGPKSLEALRGSSWDLNVPIISNTVGWIEDYNEMRIKIEIISDLVFQMKKDMAELADTVGTIHDAQCALDGIPKPSGKAKWQE